MSDEKPAESNETERGTDEARPISNRLLGAWRATIDEKRTITAWDMGDGSFAFRFQHDDNITEIRLSREAVNAMKALMLCKLNGIDA